MRTELVKDWMSTDVITIVPETTLSEAEKLMVNHTIRRLPVMENGRLLGLVTYGDIRDARPSSVRSFNELEQINNIKVIHIMSHNPIAVAPDTTIGAAALKMLTNMISTLPVLDDQEQLVGIITESDIFRLAARTWAKEERIAVEPYAHYG